MIANRLPAAAIRTLDATASFAAGAREPVN